jgi:hypothetical protein
MVALVGVLGGESSPSIIGCKGVNRKTGAKERGMSDTTYVVTINKKVPKTQADAREYPRYEETEIYSQEFAVLQILDVIKAANGIEEATAVNETKGAQAVNGFICNYCNHCGGRVAIRSL